MRKVKHDLLYISERLKERILNVFNAKQFYLFDRGHGNCPNSYTLYTSIEIAHYTYKYYTMMCPLILNHILNNIRLDMPVMYMMYLNKCIYLIFFFERKKETHIKLSAEVHIMTDPGPGWSQKSGILSRFHTCVIGT